MCIQGYVASVFCERRAIWTWTHTNVNLLSRAFIDTWSQWTSFCNMADNNATCSNCNCPWIVGIILSYLISTGGFLPPKGSVLVCKYDGHEQHSLGSTSRARWSDFPSSLALCAVSMSHTESCYSISSPPQLALNAIIKYAIDLKSVECKH